MDGQVNRLQKAVPGRISSQELRNEMLEPLPTREIPQQMEQMDILVSDILTEMTKLEAKLTPVLNNGKSDSDGKSVVPPMMTNLGSAIFKQNQQLNDICERLQEINSRIEL